MISYDTYYIAFYKNQPLKKEDLPKDYEVTSENTFTGEVGKSKPLDYEIEKFDFSELPKFEINNQETKIFEVLNNSLFASIETNNMMPYVVEIWFYTLIPNIKIPNIRAFRAISLVISIPIPSTVAIVRLPP